MMLRWYLVAAGTCVALSFLVPDGSWWQVAVQVLTGYPAVSAIIAGALRHRGTARAAWLAFAAGVGGNATGILVEAYSFHVNAEYESPGWPDVGYLALYPGLAIGLVLLIRRRSEGHDWGALVDATTVTTGLGLLAWVFMIRPAIDQTDLSPLAHLTGVAYPVGDVLVLAMLTRLLLGGGARSAAFRLMIASAFLFLAGDVTWAVLNTIGVEPGPAAHRVLGAVFLLAYVLVGHAALHRSAAQIGETAGPPPKLGPGLLVLLTLASLMAPLLLLGQIAAGEVTDALPIAICSIVLFLLVVIRMAQLLRQLEAQTARVRELSRTDELTGLPNRRAWGAELPAALERARRDGAGLAVVMIDLDHFKRFNDEYGHPAGDRLLKSAAAAWSGQLRGTDHLARYGGEEFIALLPGADTAESVAVLRRLMAATPLGQTFSAGLARWNGVETSDELVARADAALYDAKRAGRNRVEVASAQPDTDARLTPR
ncbi:GGDEF domain-containing protein [Dactylosporangium sp. CA-152071]|uniref:GGDEF domain-containing protein n=1 Tax=Dactylosporangium sp. CA-152071 TaxID=3239933 RepID=UPI003D8E42C7